jgi:hypothetical protein
LLIKPKPQHGKNQNKNTGVLITVVVGTKINLEAVQKAHVLTEAQKTAKSKNATSSLNGTLVTLSFPTRNCFS